ncbi:MAG: AMP-binding protein, partial [Chloroflexi bacterium]|nr:AMP-binding protein [Chloroflexota bacterium]
SYPGMYRENFPKFKDMVAIHYAGTAISFTQLERMSNQFANFLMKQGLKKGDVVGVNLPNVPAYYISVLGTLKAGCVLSGVSPLLTQRELEYQLNNSGAKVLVAMDLLWGNVGAIIAKTGVKAVAMVGIADFLPSDKPAATGALPSVPGITIKHFLEILKEMPDTDPKVKISPDDPALMQYTGGTTGPSKGAVLTHKNMVHHITQLVVWLDYKMGKSVILSAFPLFHQAGLGVSMWSMACGQTQIAVANPRDLAGIIQMAKTYKPTAFCNVPTIYIELVRMPAFKVLDFSNVQYFLSGAAPFPPEYIKDFEAVVGEGKVCEGLGMTETSPLSCVSPCYGKKKAGSVGLPFPDVQIKIIDPVTNEIVPIGEAGELVAKGPQVFPLGYHNMPEETAHTLRDGWIYTGDIARMDEDGYVWVVDRLKDMVNVSGYKVFTRELDDIICEHPAVAMAATIGIPDPKRPGAEMVATAVVLKPGVEKSEATRTSILDFIKEKEAPYKVPKKIEFMDQLPLSAVGKILKRELRSIMVPKA